MSIQYANNTTRGIWDMVPIPDTVVSRVNDLEKGEPEHFIFTYQKGRLIVDAELTGMETSGNQEPPQTQILYDIEVTTHLELTPP